MTVVLVVAGAIALAGFFLHIRKKEREGKEPPPQLDPSCVTPRPQLQDYLRMVNDLNVCTKSLLHIANGTR